MPGRQAPSPAPSLCAIYPANERDRAELPRKRRRLARSAYAYHRSGKPHRTCADCGHCAAKYSADLAVLLASGAALMFTSSLLTLLALRALPMIKSRAGALSLSLISAVAVETVCAGIPWSAGFWFIFAGISFGLLALEVWRELRCMERRKGKAYGTIFKFRFQTV